MLGLDAAWPESNPWYGFLATAKSDQTVFECLTICTACESACEHAIFCRIV